MKSKRDEVELAGIGRRFLAGLVDGLIIGAIGSVLLLADDSQSLLSLLVTFLYFFFFWTQQDGQTLGYRALGIRIIKLDGSSISGGDALIRYIVRVIGAVCLFLGFIWALFDAKNQAWHDKAAGTIAIRERTTVALG